MITRVFRGRVRPGREEDFRRLLVDVALPEFNAQPGFVSAHIGAPTDANPSEFLVVTVWRDLDSLKAFAGERWDEVMTSPDERAMLERASVEHFEGPPEDGEAARGERRPALRAPDRSPEAAHALLAMGPSSIGMGGTVAALRGRGLRPLLAPTAASARRLLARWRPLVAVVSAELPGATRVLRELEARDVPIVLVGDEEQLRLPEPLRTLEAAVFAPADPMEIASAAEIVAGKIPPADMPDLVEVGPLRVDLSARLVLVDGEPVELPPKELAVLTALALRPKRPLPAAELAREAWPDDPWVTADDVRRTVYRLRKLIGDQERRPPLIRNRRGFGYVLGA